MKLQKSRGALRDLVSQCVFTNAIAFLLPLAASKTKSRLWSELHGAKGDVTRLERAPH